MTRRQKGWFGAAVLLAWVCVFCATSYGEEVQKDGWTVTAVGSDDLLSMRIGTRPWAGRTEIGGFGIWLDGLKEGEDEAYGGGAYATYDVVQDANFTVLKYNVPATIYVGGQMGFLHREDSDEDATAALMTGVSFGDEKIRIGVEAQYLLSQDTWKEFGVIEDQGRLLLTLSRRF
ncbi:MAG: hypothetical protein WC455_18025 [Dehalococcoidia bacterium]|jgi:hypothetical protein